MGWELGADERYESIKAEAERLGIVHKGGPYYGPKDEPIATYVNSDGRLKPIRKNHPIQKTIQKAYPESTPSEISKEEVTALVSAPENEVAPLSPKEIEGYQADFLNFETRVLGGRISREEALQLGQELVDIGQIKRVVKQGKVQYLADEGATGIPRRFPKAHELLFQKLQEIGVQIETVTDLQAAQSPYSQQQAFIGVGATRGAHLEGKILRKGGREIGYAFGDYEEKMNEELESLFGARDESELTELEDATIERLRRTQTWRKSYEEIKRKNPKHSDSVCQRWADNFVSSELAKNRKIRFMLHNIFDRDGQPKGTVAKPADGMHVISSLQAAFTKDAALTSVEKEKVRKILTKMGGVFADGENFESYNKTVVELVNVLKQSNFKDMSSLTETLCSLASMAKGYTVVVPDSKILAVTDHVAFREDDSGKIIQTFLGNVKFGKGAASSAAARLYLGSLRGAISNFGEYVNGVAMTGKLARLLVTPRSIFKSVHSGNVEEQEAVAFIMAKEFADLVLEDYPELKNQDSTTKESAIESLMDCWGSGGEWSPARGCSVEERFPKGVISDECKTAWRIFRQRGKLAEVLNNRLQFSEQYVSMILDYEEGIREIDNRMIEADEVGDKRNHSGFKFVDATGNYDDFDAKCKMPRSTYGVRTIENEN